MAEIKPVLKYRNPEYPTMAQVIDNPQLLRDIPGRWRMKPIVCAALTFTLTSGLYACSGRGADSGNGNITELCVPVFEYGDGRGAFGCVSVVAPVFLSEDEAAQVIREEALKYGVEFTTAGELPSKDVKLPVTSIYGKEKLDAADASLTVDGYDSAHGIAFEFVSQEDVVSWQEKNPKIMSTVESYNMKQTAEKLAGGAKNLAVFYDPVPAYFDEFITEENKILQAYQEKYGDEWDDEVCSEYSREVEAVRARLEAGAREKAAEDLRSQVRDFITWLEAQGVI